MTVITEDLDLPDTTTPYPAAVRIFLAGAQGRPIVGHRVSTDTTIVGEIRLTRENGGINAAGVWMADLAPNADILPSGTTWYVQRLVPGCVDPEPLYLTVPVTGGPYSPFEVEDDPLGTIPPSALFGHAADIDLHGGGIELDYKELTTAITVTGTGGGLTTAPVTALTVTVPDVPRPVYLYAWLPAIQTSGGPAEQSWGIFPNGAYGAFSALAAAQPPDIDTTNPRGQPIVARLDPLSGGLYTIAGSGVGGNLTARLSGTTIGPALFYAVAR